MTPQRRLPCWSLCHIAGLFIYFLQGIQNAECATDDVLLVFCQCPYGYYQASRFPVLLQFTPPCGEYESTRSSTLCGRWKTYGLKCVRCHPNCEGCYGPTDSHCDTCANGFFNASFVLSDPVLPRQRDHKRTSSTENLHFFNEDEWSFDDNVESTAPRRRQKGRRNARIVRSAPVYTSTNFPRTTDLPEEQAVDDRPTIHLGGDEISSKITPASDFIEDDELIPLSTQMSDTIGTIQDFTTAWDYSDKDDTISAKMKPQLEALGDEGVNSDSGSGDVVIEDEQRAQLAPPSSYSPTQQEWPSHPPTTANYFYPETRHPAPVKRNGGTAENIFENIRILSNPDQKPPALPSPAALYKFTQANMEFPEELVSFQATNGDFKPRTTASPPPPSTRTKAPSGARGTRKTKQEGATHSKTGRSSRINMRSANAETSTTELDNQPISPDRTTRRRIITTTNVPRMVATRNNEKNHSIHQSTTNRRSRKTTVLPQITEQTYTLSDITDKPIIIVSRSTVKDVSHSGRILTAAINETRYNGSVTTDNVNYKTNLMTPVTDSTSTLHITHTFRCVSVCPNGTYKDFSENICQTCDSKCRTCVGPSFMNCTSCAPNAVQAANSPPNVSGHVLTVTCLSECPGSHFVHNGTCTPCHESCDECYGFGPSQCFKCRHPQPDKNAAAANVHSATPPSLCIGEKEERDNQLELILPLAFVCFLVLVTVVICIRWNCKLSDFCFFKTDFCNKLKKAEDKENLSSLPKKLATSGIIRNEYTPSPPNGTCQKCQSSTTDDGYELPLHPSAGSASNYTPSSLRSSTSSANHTMIKPRRNDPLPLTPVELDAIKRRESNASSNVYKNIPQTYKAAEAADQKGDIEAIPGTSSQNEEDGRYTEKTPETHLILTDTAYSNSEGLYANC